MNFWLVLLIVYVISVFVFSIWFGIGYYTDRKYEVNGVRKDEPILGMSIFAGAGSSLIIAPAVTLFIGFMMYMSSAEVEPYGEPTVVELQSLGDMSASGGTLYLGTGTIEGERSINYTTKESNGRVHLETVRLEDSEVYEIEGKTPTVEIQPWAHMREWPWEGWGKHPDNEFTRYIFTIPPGSTTNDFVIDNN